MDLNKIIKILEEDISYFDLKNDNLTKMQMEKIDDIKEMIEDLKTYRDLKEDDYWEED